MSKVELYKSDNYRVETKNRRRFAVADILGRRADGSYEFVRSHDVRLTRTRDEINAGFKSIKKADADLVLRNFVANHTCTWFK